MRAERRRPAPSGKRPFDGIRPDFRNFYQASAAISGYFAACKFASENVYGTCVDIYAHAAPAVGGALDCAASLTVTEDKPAAVFDLDFIGAVAGIFFAVQAEVQRSAVNHKV